MTNTNGEKHVQVLLVDDEKHFREILAKRLVQRGIHALEAGAGDEALQVLEKNSVDVIIMDVKMPGINGIETLRQVKEKFPSVEVIMLTGHASTRDGVDGIKSGAFDYLTKPIEFEQLLRKIRQAYHKIQRLEAERREAEFRERIKQQMAVNERLVALGTIAASVAHEINNPLAVIQDSAGWVRQILGKPEMSTIPRKADFEKAMDRIHSSVDRAKRITQQLLQVVKTKSKEFADPASMKEINLKELVEECIGLVEMEAIKKKIEVDLKNGPSQVIVKTDPYQLAQVFLNLLTNAIQATDEGGHIYLSVQQSGEQVDLKIQDTGCGIPQENIDKIFDPFFTTKGSDEGTGMGLYISKDIIRKLGGKLTVESQVGQGTVFTMSFPY